MSGSRVVRSKGSLAAVVASGEQEDAAALFSSRRGDFFLSKAWEVEKDLRDCACWLVAWVFGNWVCRGLRVGRDG